MTQPFRGKNFSAEGGKGMWEEAQERKFSLRANVVREKRAPIVT